MRRDRTEGRWVNLCKPPEGGPITLSDGEIIDPEIQENEPNDFYSIIAAALWKKLQGESPALLGLLDGPFDRKIVKTPVMSYFYGATVKGMSDQIADEIRDRNKKRRRDKKSSIPIRHDLFLHYAANGVLYGKFIDTFLPYKLAEILFALLEESGAPRAAETRNHLIKLAELCTEYKKILRFDTLHGLSVIGSYFHPDVERLVCSGKRGRRRDIMVAIGDGDEINKDRAENAIAANFVHSADATLLHLVALAVAEKSVPLLSIHDCFATTAPFAATLNEIVRDCFIRLHRHNWLNTIWQAARKILPKDVAMPPRLEIGDLDPNEVKSNSFFIN